VTAPVLIASGTHGFRTNRAEAVAMFERARSPKSLWLVEGAGHTDLERYAPDEYRSRIVPFLVETLRRTD
jgi:hypothetical protein